MKRKRKTEHRPKKKTANKSPWRKYKTVPETTAAPPVEIIIPPVSDVDSLADEVEAMEADPNAEPPEENE
jgi:hypothetical protein